MYKRSGAKEKKYSSN